MEDIIQIDFLQLLGVILFVILATIISLILKLKIEKDMWIGMVRSFVQLILVGYILDWIFNLNRWYLVAAILFMMLGAAAFNAMRRQTKKYRGLTPRFFISIGTASFISIFFGVGLIINPSPLWDPQYLIPIGGMIIGNAMSSGALATERLYSEFKGKSDVIESALSLGAPPHKASIEATRSALKAGMLPMISTMMVVGIVHLPGMMTGQIVGGVSPGQAVRYQLIILYILLVTNALSALLSTLLVRKLFFGERDHLVLPE